MEISYGFCHSPFGECLLATTSRGICFLGFVDSVDRSSALDQLLNTWSGAAFTEQSPVIEPIGKKIFEPVSLKKALQTAPLTVLLKGTPFQVEVWNALRAIPKGSTLYYQEVASSIGRPKAVRAVANAIAKNPVSYLIPCHRVIAKSGKIHQYRWGSATKELLLKWEASL